MPEPITKITGKAAPLEADDVDTDQIIPAEFLKLIQRKGLGQYLFYRWRRDEAGKLSNNFVLDKPEFKDAKVLVAGRNFGIGSSRENAVWSLTDFGIGCVIASSFGDIFYNNASKNGLVCIKLPEDTLKSLRYEAASGKLVLTIDLEKQTVGYGRPKRVILFEMERDIKERLTNGLDDIALTLSKYEDKINAYEDKIPSFVKPRGTVK